MKRANLKNLLKGLKNITNKKTVKIAILQLLIKQLISKTFIMKKKNKRTKTFFKTNRTIIYLTFIQILRLP